MPLKALEQTCLELSYQISCLCQTLDKKRRYYEKCVDKNNYLPLMHTCLLLRACEEFQPALNNLMCQVYDTRKQLFYCASK